MNWLHAAVASGVVCYAVVALDDELQGHLAGVGVPSCGGSKDVQRAARLFGLSWPCGRLRAVWGLRCLLLHAALVSGPRKSCTLETSVGASLGLASSSACTPHGAHVCV